MVPFTTVPFLSSIDTVSLFNFIKNLQNFPNKIIKKKAYEYKINGAVNWGRRGIRVLGGRRTWRASLWREREKWQLGLRSFFNQTNEAGEWEGDLIRWRFIWCRLRTERAARWAYVGPLMFKLIHEIQAQNMNDSINIFFFFLPFRKNNSILTTTLICT